MLKNSVDYELFSDILSDNFLTQMVLQPIRGDSILDLVLTNNSDVICVVEVGEPISDHNVISFNVNVHPYHRKSSERRFYDFKADWLRLNELFQPIPWHCAFLSNDVNEVWIAWTDLFFTAVDECISRRRKKKNRRAPWISAEIIKLVRKKKRLYKKAKNSSNIESWSTYKEASNLSKKECNKARWKYLDKLANDMHDNSEHKFFWNYVQSRRKGSNDLIVIKMDNGNVLTNEGDIAERVNEYFPSVFIAENFPSFDQVIKDRDLSFIHCSPKDVSKILSELKPRKSPGQDSIYIPSLIRAKI